MWSQFLLCLLVAIAAASTPAWKVGTEYVYQIRGRTLTGLYEVNDEYTGILLKAQLYISPKSEEVIAARIADAQYAQIQAHLPDGWFSYIPDHQLNYKPLALSKKPFEFVLKNGVVKDLIVDQEVQNWEANIIKSILSQIQLDTKGENLIESRVNQLPEEGTNTGVYKVMEDTVTGKYETLYEINPLPEYVLESKPWFAPMPHLKGDGHMIEIVKNKNFSHSDERVTYHYGLTDMGYSKPSTNQMGEFFSRTSVSRAIVSGHLNRYTIQSSETINKIILSPTLHNQQKGMVVSQMNITLHSMQQQSSKYEEIASPLHLGSLVYRYNTPFAGNYQARAGQQHVPYTYKKSYDSSSSSSEESRKYHSRGIRSIQQQLNENSDSHSSSGSYNSALRTGGEEYWHQDKPQMTHAPESPLLPYYIGYMGKSIKSSDKVNIVQSAQKLAQQIGHELQHPEYIPKEQTLSKYVVLGALTRIMNEKEMKEVARLLYTKEQGPAGEAWKVYRDAVAECGTGPALLTVQEWIETEKIKYEEAAEVISTLAYATRQPTEEYVRYFYTLVTKPEVQRQYLLNDTAILCYSELIRKVYVDKHYSHDQYPVHSFGSFRTETGIKFYKNEYIPYLAKQLEKAVSEADSHKILVYIRALGNVAHKEILAVFKPYFEGKQKVSHFQRLQMVLALDRFVKIYPKEARSVLYKIYLNPTEKPEIRVAAVYQLIRTNPPTSMLQRMAEYTNIDTSEQVNAAVKSAIESLCKLEGYEFTYLRSSAEAARPLLTPKEYGIHYSRDYLRTYIVDEMNMFYKQSVHYYGSEESYVPKGLKYAFRAHYGGVKRQFFTVQAMVSSINELTDVLYQQTAEYQQYQQQQTQYAQQAEQSKYSSEYIARLLNIYSEEKEQLEGNVLLQFGGLQRFFTYNNRTIELLPHALQELEEILRNGKTYQYTKFVNRQEMVVSFPTEMALPFIYTLDSPTLLHVSGSIKATATPKVCRSDKIHEPEHVNSNTEVRAVLSTKIQGHLGFVTPFDHQQYTSGYDKNIHTYIPLRMKLDIDLKNKQLYSEVQALEPEKDTKFVHYSTWPFTAKHDILSMKPISNQHTTHIVYNKPLHQYKGVYGQKETGMAFRYNYTTEERFIDYRWLYEQLRHQDIMSVVMAPWTDNYIRYNYLDISYAGDVSSARKVNVRLGYTNEYHQQADESSASYDINQLGQYVQEPKARQQQYAKKVSAGIRSANVYVFDASVEFHGQHKVEYALTTAIAKSNVDQKSRVLFFINKYSTHPDSKSYQIAAIVKSHYPNTNGLDFNYALKFDPSSASQIQFAFGETIQTGVKLNMHMQYRKSEQYKEYLLNHPMYYQCKREMEQGNYQLPACANMTQMANLMDYVTVEVKTENWSPKYQYYVDQCYRGLTFLGYWNMEEYYGQNYGNGKQNELNFEARFYPDFQAANISMKTEGREVVFRNLRINRYVRPYVSVHPVFHVKSRVYGQLLGLQTFRPICVVDKTATLTFNNRTYPIGLSHDWTLMFQYLPYHARYYQHKQQSLSEDLSKQFENYAVYVREHGQSKQKEVKIYYRVPQTQGKPFEIELIPAGQQSSGYTGSNPCAKVLVNGKQIQYNDKQSTDFNNGYLQVYALPNGELKLELQNAFYIIYDGARVKVTLLNGKFRNSVRGLCGTNNGDKYTDFRTPKNCYVREPEQFVATYTTYEQGSQNEHYQQLRTKAEKYCTYQELMYTKVISERDMGHYERHGLKHGRCIKYQTRYIVEDNGNTFCFTLRPMPVCKGTCRSNKLITKKVDVICVEKSNISEMWKNQIDKGASPDFSLKTPTKSVRMELPASCSP